MNEIFRDPTKYPQRESSHAGAKQLLTQRVSAGYADKKNREPRRGDID